LVVFDHQQPLLQPTELKTANTVIRAGLKLRRNERNFGPVLTPKKFLVSGREL